MKKLLVRLLLVLIVVIVLVPVTVAVAFTMVNRTNGQIVSSGQTRRYFLYVPESYHPQTPTPLVISIHGFAEWPAHQMQISRWNDLAEAYGFIVVYPSGTRFPLRWVTYQQPDSETNPLQDVIFISDLIDQLQTEYNLDPLRIYANGLSNGGGMSFLLACALSDRVAAVGLVAGAFTLPWEECHPERPVPAIAFHGTEDPIVPFGGGPSSSFHLAFPALPEWIETLAERNGCARQVEEPAQGEVSGVRYTDCDQDAEVVFFTIAGGGHSWPGGEPLPAWIVGSTTQDIDATGRMWEFFQQHPMPPE